MRLDPLSGHLGIVASAWSAPKRSLPGAVGLELPSPPGDCPFCPAGDGAIAGGTGPEGARFDSHGRWMAVSVRNAWPLTPEPAAHEVVVLTRHHDAHLLDLPPADVQEALSLILERADAQRRAGRVPLIMLNHGVMAGSSQPHAHAQMLGLRRRDGLAEREATMLSGPACVLCDRSDRRRIVATGTPLSSRSLPPRVAHTTRSSFSRATAVRWTSRASRGASGWHSEPCGRLPDRSHTTCSGTSTNTRIATSSPVRGTPSALGIAELNLVLTSPEEQAAKLATAASAVMTQESGGLVNARS